jgi:thioredoxin-dependent peroxiredoxin
MSEGLLEVGSVAPSFRAETSTGDAVALDELRESGSVLLMFYPQDDTPGCTRQMCAARDEGATYRDAGVARFGVNHGTLASHTKFADKYSLDFPIIVDQGGEIARSYGVQKENGGTARATYLIGRDGKILYAQPGAHAAEEVLEALRG